MTKEQYWEVKLHHIAEAYNDNTEYAIMDGNERIVATDTSLNLLSKIASAHNKCFLEEATP